MPARLPHAAGLQLAGEPPSFEAYKAKPASEWTDAQDVWLDKFSEGKSARGARGFPALRTHLAPTNAICISHH